MPPFAPFAARGLMPGRGVPALTRIGS